MSWAEKHQFGRMLRTLRVERQWTLGDLAERSGVDKSVLSRLEAGLTRMAHDATLQKLADVYGIPVERLKESTAAIASAPNVAAPSDDPFSNLSKTLSALQELAQAIPAQPADVSRQQAVIIVSLLQNFSRATQEANTEVKVILQSVQQSLQEANALQKDERYKRSFAAAEKGSTVLLTSWLQTASMRQKENENLVQAIRSESGQWN